MWLRLRCPCSRALGCSYMFSRVLRAVRRLHFSRAWLRLYVSSRVWRRLHFSNAWIQILHMFSCNWWRHSSYMFPCARRGYLAQQNLYRHPRKIGYLVTSTSLFFNSSMSSCTWAIFASYCWFVKPFSSSASSTFFFRSRCLDRSSSNCFDVRRSSFSNARSLSLFSSNPALYCCT